MARQQQQQHATPTPTRISLILAVVFPAIVAAALSLAYYGYRYAVASSQRSKASLMEGNREAALLLIGRLQTRIDEQDLQLFQQIEWDNSSTLEPSFEIPSAIESYVVLDEHLRITSMVPTPDARSRKSSLDRWRKVVQGLDWNSLQPWTASQVGNFRHLHQLSDGKSQLIAYAAKRTAEGEPYYVAARLDLKVITEEWLPDEARTLAANRRIAVLDEMDRPVFGQGRIPRDHRFLYEASFGKTLYAWRIQLAPRNVEDLQAQAARERLIGLLLIPLAVVIMAVGLGVVWLAMAAERRASRMRSDFIANVSHELKTPLSLIRMFGELLATGKHKGEGAAREYGEIITRESERLAHLIDNVLDFSRLERGKASYHFAEAPLAEVVHRALDVCRYRFEKERIRLVLDAPTDLPLVRMDENAMALVLLNLVDNSIKYAADGGMIEVRLQRAPGGVVLAVKDHGPGIPVEEHRRIFERFYRAATARMKNVRGSGIGLALVKHIVEAHGGWVKVDSRPGQGATFSVFVPAAPVVAGAGGEAVEEGLEGSSPHPGSSEEVNG